MFDFWIKTLFASMQIPETFLKPGKFVSHVQHRYRLSHIDKVDDAKAEVESPDMFSQTKTFSSYKHTVIIERQTKTVVERLFRTV